MATGQSSSWYLRKHGAGEVFGPVPFEQIREWADSAYINPQDTVSNDGKTWTKAPMIADLQMDWLIEVPDNPLYGPTSAGTLLEFLTMGEISTDTRIVNCCTGETLTVDAVPFLQPSVEGEGFEKSPQGVIKTNLQKRIMELETELLEKAVELDTAKQTITTLQERVAELENRVWELEVT
jgi:hypothetical protein